MRDRLKKFDKNELIDLLVSYNNYIIDFFEVEEWNENDRTPVCVMEFYDNEYQEEVDE